jgi:hypothetical protein|tara:strand:- start:251 stop:466 length:216 start_codon:yes stop_codon:yes gene_type:complete
MIKKEWHWMSDYKKQKQMSIIKEKNLSHIDVWNIVNEWYVNGMYADILQDENGADLEEICEWRLYKLNKNK